MFGLGSFLDRDVEDWHIETWAWLIKNGSRKARPDFFDTKLVLPDANCFPETNAQGHDKAWHIFDAVRIYAGMDGWAVDLVAQQEEAGRLSDLAYVKTDGACAAGTFRMSGNRGIITYDPKYLQKPASLIATFSHELGHYLNSGFRVPPPGGWDLIEPATDVTSTFLGFGIFGASAAFEFGQFSEAGLQGWQSSRLGYLTQDQWIFDLAIFCALTDTEIRTAKPYLKSHLWGQLKKATKYVERHDIAGVVMSYTSDNIISIV